MQWMLKLVGVLLLVDLYGCTSDAEREAILKKYEEPLTSTAVLANCDKSAAQHVKRDLSAPEMGRETFEDGWVVMTFGSDYRAWTVEQRKGLVEAFANADACLTQEGRKIEFDAPSGKTIARADNVRGIRFLDEISK